MGLYSLITLLLLITLIYLAVKNHRLKLNQRHFEHQFDETTLIVESLRDGLIECDIQMVPTRVNHSAEVILGIEASQIVNRAFDKNNIVNETDRKLVQVLFSPKDSKDSYDVLLGELKLRIFTIPKTDPHSKTLIGYIKIIRDVTIETIVEKHKDDLVSIVSHQLLTPLTGIKWILKSLGAGDAGPLSAKQIDMIKKGLGANESMIGLVTDILDVTKVEQARFAYKKAPCEIVGFVREMIASRREKAETRNVRIQEQMGIDSKEIIFDKERMGIALGNILDNAIDYSPQSGTVMVNVSGDAQNVTISVNDKGIGVPPAQMGNLFTKFYRADNAKRVRTSGTGLGLYLAKHIIEDHGGRIKVESKENEGSTFSIALPIGMTQGSGI